MVNLLAVQAIVIAALQEIGEMRYNPRTGKMRLVDPRLSRIATKSHRKLKGKHRPSAVKMKIRKGLRKADRTGRNRFGKPTLD